jgi:hypothetical protein
MPILTALADAVTKPLPKVMSPKAHAIADYITIASFLVTGALFRRRNKRAALGALVCGGAALATSVLTDYTGGSKKLLSFPLHLKIDIGLAAMMATMPEFMAFYDDREKKFFLVEAGIVTAVANLTEVRRRPPRSLRKVIRDVA